MTSVATSRFGGSGRHTQDLAQSIDGTIEKWFSTYTRSVLSTRYSADATPAERYRAPTSFVHNE
jgi:hypothetical protein